jgi:electron transfer flavoprotein alpha subunit
MTTLLVFIEHSAGAPRRGSLEALGAARAAGANTIAVLCGPGADAVATGMGSAGATKAIVLTGAEAFSPDQVATGLAEVLRAEGANGFLAAATSRGKDLAPRVAAHLDSVLFTDCTGLSAAGEGLQVQRSWLAGKVLADLTSDAEFFCATTRLNVFEPATGEGQATVSEHALSAAPKVTVTGVEAKGDAKLDVSEAAVVVAGGRGLKEAEGFGILEELAAAFGNAAVGASRAVVDAGWRSHAEQVGQTGKVVAPQLYIAVGISGAIQHLAGMRTSGTIVAINKDADAPIFKVADYGIVGDAFEIVPALTAAVMLVKAEA